MRKLKFRNYHSKLILILVLLFNATGILEAKTEADSDLKTRDLMLQVSRELGVTCTYCHNSENFKDSKNKNFGIARDHFRILHSLNSESGFNAKPKVSCFVCHQGKAKFEYAMKPDPQK